MVKDIVTDLERVNVIPTGLSRQPTEVTIGSERPEVEEEFVDAAGASAVAGWVSFNAAHSEAEAA